MQNCLHLYDTTFVAIISTPATRNEVAVSLIEIWSGAVIGV